MEPRTHFGGRLLQSLCGITWVPVSSAQAVLGDPWGLLGETSGGLRGDAGLLWITWGAFVVPWIALWKGLLAFGRPLGRFVGAFGILAAPLGTSGSVGKDLQGSQSSCWQTVATKSLVLRVTFGGFCKHLGAF